MLLVDSIVSKSVGSAMASSRALANMNSTTLAQAGTSIPDIQRKATTAAKSAIDYAGAQQALSSPIEQMRQYAVANTLSSVDQTAINNAAVNATNVMDATFTTSLPGVNYGLYDIQNGVGEAMASGISSFGINLKTINPSIVDGAMSVGNSALSDARQYSDNLCTASYNAATKSVADQVMGANNALADKVKAENATVQDKVYTTLDTSTSSNAVFSTSGVWAGSEGAVPAGYNTTDVIYQDVKLYVEGVQVPYEAISISQNIGNLPSAVVQIPPHSGLMDIARYYQPKIHVFFTDKNLGGDRLLFWGHIVACNYAKSRQQGMATISFRCVHKNALFDQVTLEWSDYANNVMTGSDPNVNQAVAQPSALNSMQSLVSALKGLTGMQTDPKDLISPSNPDVKDADVTKLDQRWANFQKRFVGMPAASMNLWNQLKQTCYSNAGFNTIMSRIYVPLVEEGIAFFDRLSGHYYLENIIEESKQDGCNDQAPAKEQAIKVMVPPSFRLPSLSAISSTMAIRAIVNQLGFSGEMMTFAQLFRDFYLTVEYEMITLASPAQVPADPTVMVNPDDPNSTSTIPMMAVETIIKPQIPFYYSPLCNVLLPRMYHSVSIDQEEEVVPTRITAFHHALPKDTFGSSQNYRGPHSIREAIAIGIGLTAANGAAAGVNQQAAANAGVSDVNLAATTGSSYNIPGKYEQGRGLKNSKIVMPYWLSLMIQGKNAESDPTDEVWPAKGSKEYAELMNLYAAWVDRYGYDIVNDDGVVKKGARNKDKDALNPYSDKAKIGAHQRLLFLTADYEFTKQVAQARNGMIECVFNPYIVPGYPMDIIDESPNHPSFHGLCTSVTHSITPRSIGTTVGIAAAMTYSEMSNYYLAPLHPWLQTALQLVNVTWNAGNGAQDSLVPPSSDSDQYGDVDSAKTVRQTLINNPAAKYVADQFYRSVFGVDAVSPDQIYDFSNGQAIPIARSNGTWGVGTPDSLPLPNGGDDNDFRTTVGNLRLVCRPIEGRKAIEGKFDVKFIDLLPANYTADGVEYQNPVLSSDMLLEPGASLFLDYEETKDFVNQAASEAKAK